MKTLPKSKLTKSQFKTLEKRVTSSKIYPNVKDKLLIVNIRYDDDCGNGHNSFAITGELRKEVSGCIHDIIAEQFPELKKYLKWHLCSSDGPMHYVSNSLYHASDRDCWGKKKGEPSAYDYYIQFGASPITHKVDKKLKGFIQDIKSFFKTLTIVEREYVNRNGNDYSFSPKFSFKEYEDYTDNKRNWYDALFNTKQKAEQWKQAIEECQFSIKKEATQFGEGKEPELGAAKNSAIWPTAKLEDFTKEKLEERLPSLMNDFKSDMIELGFTY